MQPWSKKSCRGRDCGLIEQSVDKAYALVCGGFLSNAGKLGAYACAPKAPGLYSHGLTESQRQGIAGVQVMGARRLRCMHMHRFSRAKNVCGLLVSCRMFPCAGAFIVQLPLLND
jgi:hypothetical protein